MEFPGETADDLEQVCKLFDEASCSALLSSHLGGTFHHGSLLNLLCTLSVVPFPWIWHRLELIRVIRKSPSKKRDETHEFHPSSKQTFLLSARLLTSSCIGAFFESWVKFPGPSFFHLSNFERILINISSPPPLPSLTLHAFGCSLCVVLAPIGVIRVIRKSPSKMRDETHDFHLSFKYTFLLRARLARRVSEPFLKVE